MNNIVREEGSDEPSHTPEAPDTTLPETTSGLTRRGLFKALIGTAVYGLTAWGYGKATGPSSENVNEKHPNVVTVQTKYGPIYVVYSKHKYPNSPELLELLDLKQNPLMALELVGPPYVEPGGKAGETQGKFVQFAYHQHQYHPLLEAAHKKLVRYAFCDIGKESPLVQETEKYRNKAGIISLLIIVISLTIGLGAFITANCIKKRQLLKEVLESKTAKEWGVAAAALKLGGVYTLMPAIDQFILIGLNKTSSGPLSETNPARTLQRGHRSIVHQIHPEIKSAREWEIIYELRNAILAYKIQHMQSKYKHRQVLLPIGTLHYEIEPMLTESPEQLEKRIVGIIGQAEWEKQKRMILVIPRANGQTTVRPLHF